MSRRVIAVVCSVVGLGWAYGCGGPESQAPAAPPSSPQSSAPPTASEPPRADPPPASGGIPTSGLPTKATFELLKQGKDADNPVVRAYRRFWVIRTEGIRAGRMPASFKKVATPQVIQQEDDEAERRRQRGHTVGLRPVGRLESLRVSAAKAKLVACVWQPSVAYYVEANGEPAEQIDQKWVEIDAAFSRSSDSWVVAEIGPTGQSCRGGKP